MKRSSKGGQGFSVTPATLLLFLPLPGDTLCVHGDPLPVKLAGIRVPPPVFAISLEVSSRGADVLSTAFTGCCLKQVENSVEAKKLEEALEVLLREDPSLKKTYDEETGECAGLHCWCVASFEHSWHHGIVASWHRGIVASWHRGGGVVLGENHRCCIDTTDQVLLHGMGELHLEVTLHRLRHNYGVDVTGGKVRVAYKEGVITEGEAEVRLPSTFASTCSSHFPFHAPTPPPCRGSCDAQFTCDREFGSQQHFATLCFKVEPAEDNRHNDIQAFDGVLKARHDVDTAAPRPMLDEHQEVLREVRREPLYYAWLCLAFATAALLTALPSL